MPFVIISIVTNEQCVFRPNDYIALEEFDSECEAETILNLCIKTHNHKAKQAGVETRMREEFIIIERPAPVPEDVEKTD